MPMIKRHFHYLRLFYLYFKLFEGYLCILLSSSGDRHKTDTSSKKSGVMKRQTIFFICFFHNSIRVKTWRKGLRTLLSCQQHPKWRRKGVVWGVNTVSKPPSDLLSGVWDSGLAGGETTTRRMIQLGRRENKLRLSCKEYISVSIE